MRHSGDPRVKGVRRCSQCGERGHNATTCGREPGDPRARYKKKMRATGRCLTCGTDSGGAQLCVMHATIKSERLAERKARKQREGLCSAGACRRKLAPTSRVLCTRHLEIERERGREKRKKRERRRELYQKHKGR